MLIQTHDLFERWHPFWKWEDLAMWEQRKNEMTRIQACARLLADPIKCQEAMEGAVAVYPISAEQHLTKPSGRRPWIGQAACNYALDATEEETRIAWNFYMAPGAQDRANAVADFVIAAWEKNNA